MRMAFGLVSVLIAVAIVIYLMVGKGGPGSGGLGYVHTVAREGNSAKEEIREIAGQTADGKQAVSETITFSIGHRGGKYDHILIEAVQPGGEMERRFGLQVADQIIRIGPLDVRDNISSEDDARAFLIDAYQRGQSIVVRRHGREITLPQGRGDSPAGVLNSLGVPSH